MGNTFAHLAPLQIVFIIYLRGWVDVVCAVCWVEAEEQQEEELNERRMRSKREREERGT